MRLKIIFSAAFILIINLFSGYSQGDTLKLTLNDALEMAQARSSDALIAKQGFRIKYWQYRSFKADYLPSVNMNANLPGYNRSFRIVSVKDGPDIFQYNTGYNYFAGISINQKIGYTGGSVFIESQLQRMDNIYHDSTYIDYVSVPIIIGYTQPIFKYNEYRWAKKLEPLK